MSFSFSFLSFLQNHVVESGPLETETSSGKSSKDDGSAFPNEVIQFPNEDDEGDELEKGTKWKDVHVNKWYRIEDKKDVTSKFGPTTLLTMRDRSNTRVLVWATKLITESIDSKWEEKEGVTLFIRSLGKKKSASSVHSYYDFKYKIIKHV